MIHRMFPRTLAKNIINEMKTFVGSNFYLSPMFSILAPIIHWSFTILCHNSLIDKVDSGTLQEAYCLPVDRKISPFIVHH